MHDCLVESDSAFIITGLSDSSASDQQKLFMMRLNGAGEVQWCRSYAASQHWGTFRPSRILRTLDGNHVLLATIFDALPRPFLAKTDQNGDTLWTRSAGAFGYAYNTASLLGCSDGGFAYSGIADGNFGLESAAPFIFKTDSLGHLPCSEKAPPSIVVSELFPVDSTFTLSSIDGAVASAVIVDDSAAVPVPMIEGCTITSTPLYVQARRFRAYPNPNTGHFTVQFEDPLMAESYYSVFDTMGMLLYQRPLAIGKLTEEVDLSRFAKGTYVIKFTDPSGVCFERVVVE